MTPQSPPVAEPKFKVGDKVECVDDGGGNYVRNGHVYTVTDTFPAAGTVAVDGVVGAHWEMRFRLSAPAPVDETKAPERLPEWLEPGTTWTANRGSSHGEFTFRLLSRAHNDGGWARGCDQWQILGAYERIAPTHQHFTRPPDNITLAEVNWSSVTALRSPPAPPEADRLHAEGCVLCGGPEKYTSGELGFGYCLACLNSCCEKYPNKSRVVDLEYSRRKSLAKDAPDESMPCPKCGSRFDLLRQQCSSCSFTAKQAVIEATAKGRPKPDPYAEHRDRVACLVEFEMTTDDAARIAAMQAKLDSARADLDRPTRPKKFGRLGELDRFGATLSSVGWETED